MPKAQRRRGLDMGGLLPGEVQKCTIAMKSYVRKQFPGHARSFGAAFIESLLQTTA